jgi:hypothetical protein
MTQVGRVTEYRATPEQGEPASLGPEIGQAEKNEDLFVFTVQHVTLKKGERMVVPVAEFTLPTQDVFTLDIPFGPPPEVRGNVGNEQQRDLVRLLNSPKVMHKVRLSNTSKYPLTTAPALIISNGRVLAQGLMTYTAVGAKVDLPITAAVDFQVKKSDLEVKRTPDAIQENGNHYARIDMTGKVTLTSHRTQPTEVEINRYVLGTADGAENGGKVEKLNTFESPESLTTDNSPSWWSSYSWPYWWNHFNGVSRVTWKLTIDPKQTLELGYSWHYFWQ